MRALSRQGHHVVCLGRRADPAGPGGVTTRAGSRDGFAGERFDAVVYCQASRTGAPREA